MTSSSRSGQNFLFGVAWPPVDGLHSLKLGLKYYDGRVPTILHTARRLINVLKDLNSRMPLEEARDSFQRIKQIGRIPENPLPQCIDRFI